MHDNDKYLALKNQIRSDKIMTIVDANVNNIEEIK